MYKLFMDKPTFLLMKHKNINYNFLLSVEIKMVNLSNYLTCSIIFINIFIIFQNNIKLKSNLKFQRILNLLIYQFH